MNDPSNTATLFRRFTAPRSKLIEAGQLLRSWCVELLGNIRSLVSHHPAITDGSMAAAAIGGMASIILFNFPVRTEAFAASDLKTLYASTWNFAHGRNAYTIPDVQSVFTTNGTILPEHWFGHAPVYPPTTLALLLPFAMIRMEIAAYVVVLLSSVLFAVAVAALLRYSTEMFSLPLGAKAAITALCASSPLLSFALSMGNLSVIAAALVILCFVRREHGSIWLNGSLLAIAVLLKPHLSVWMLLGMWLIPERASRAIAARAASVIGIFALVVAGGLAVTGTLKLQMGGFASILHAETSAGFSMNPSSREILPICAQITSLQSLVGFWRIESVGQTVLVSMVLIALGCTILLRTLTVRTEEEAVIAITTWSSFGLLASYHRVHDALVLLLLLPWLARAVIRNPSRWYPWAIAFLYSLLSFAPSLEQVQRQAATGHENFIMFILLRQAGVVSLALLIVLLISWRDSSSLAARYVAAPRYFPGSTALQLRRVRVAESSLQLRDQPVWILIEDHHRHGGAKQCDR